jgi:hypothetical protein
MAAAEEVAAPVRAFVDDQARRRQLVLGGPQRHERPRHRHLDEGLPVAAHLADASPERERTRRRVDGDLRVRGGVLFVEEEEALGGVEQRNPQGVALQVLSQ